ncbi:hypothetical protein FSP39_008905 [Pinctada imbricata]|uniref:CCHC-type domain-containing protein n=1 Tax=Pinctada imbricata TaxID=66713 RepID=A0AA88XQU5_PINIB|nr:hypothetical protein FSP39_008905 [Pinctada imbricata]
MADELSKEELEAIAAAFKEMKVKPKADSASDLKKWMVDYVAQIKDADQTTTQPTATVKQEPSSDATSTSKILSQHIPKLSCFSGDQSKQDTSYDLWRYEVDCLVREKYSESSIAQAIRRSLRGDAGKVAMRLGPEAKVADILDKMESVFGTMERGEKILEEFYSAKQKKDEDSMAWSCRLEEIFRKAVVKGVMSRSEANDKLRSRYWNGLHQWIQDVSGYKYDRLTEFDDLRKEVRLIEKEHVTKKAQVNMAIPASTEQPSELQELKGMIQQLTAKVTHLEKDKHRGSQTTYRGGYGGTGRQQQQRGRQGQQQWYPSYNYPRDDLAYYEPYTEEPVCYRCGQPGHLELGCRVILDHRRKPTSNFSRPASRGRR